MLQNRGISTLSVLSSLAVGLIAFAAFCESVSFSRKASVHSRNKAVAEDYISELLEYLRSLTPAQVLAYLSVNPFSGSTLTPDLYPLCAHINLIDRSNVSNLGYIPLNRDPLADLPASSLTTGEDARLANRFYQVHVVDSRTLVPNILACGQKPNAYLLLPNEALLITVGVSWVPAGSQTPERMSLSTMVIN